MKILWIAYNPLHIIRAQLDSQAGDGRGGWLDAAADQVTRHGDVQLAYCFPYKQNCEGNAGGIDYYSAPMVPAVRYRDIRRYKKADFERFQYILAKTRPDVIHIWGTETWFQRQFVFMAGELGLLKKTVIWIQGMVFFWGGFIFQRPEPSADPA